MEIDELVFPTYEYYCDEEINIKNEEETVSSLKTLIYYPQIFSHKSTKEISSIQFGIAPMQGLIDPSYLENDMGDSNQLKEKRKKKRNLFKKKKLINPPYERSLNTEFNQLRISDEREGLTNNETTFTLNSEFNNLDLNDSSLKRKRKTPSKKTNLG